MSRSRVGLWLDLSRCTGCRACQVACQEWNQLDAVATTQDGGYQNPPGLGGDTWKQVKFLEVSDDRRATRWLFYSDSCKHCFDAPCMNACPTGAIQRTAQGVIRIDPQVCTGSGHCVPACPYGVIAVSEASQVAQKCTLCEDRLGEGREPACAAVCPTDTIQFGPRADLVERARDRLEVLTRQGHYGAQLYGVDELGGLGVFYLLMDVPSTYGIPNDPVAPAARVAPASALAVLWGLAALLLAAFSWGGPG